jgi:hypothetical protein
MAKAPTESKSTVQLHFSPASASWHSLGQYSHMYCMGALCLKFSEYRYLGFCGLSFYNFHQIVGSSLTTITTELALLSHCCKNFIYAPTHLIFTIILCVFLLSLFYGEGN